MFDAIVETVRRSGEWIGALPQWLVDELQLEGYTCEIIDTNKGKRWRVTR